MIKRFLFVFAFVSLIFSSCILWPYYKTMPYLPAVTGIITDSENQDFIEGVKISWKNDDNPRTAIVFSDSSGVFNMPMIQKYVTWKIVFMDTGWGGMLVLEKEGYKTVEYSVGGFYNPEVVYKIEIQLEKNQPVLQQDD